MNSVAIKDSSVTTENGKDIHKSVAAIVVLLRQSFQHGTNPRKHFCCDITFRVHNKEQQNFVMTKIIYVATNKG